MSSAPLSDRLHAGARALMIALGERHRVLPLWAVTYLLKAIDRLRRGAVDLLRKLEAGTYRPRAQTLARRLRPLCRLVGIAIPDWLRAPPRPRRPRAKPAHAAPAKRPPPDPSKPNWRMLRDACRADYVLRTWTGSGAPPNVLVHSMRHLLSPEVIDRLRPYYKFLNVMFPR